LQGVVQPTQLSDPRRDPERQEELEVAVDFSTVGWA
jgi:hypothetical protein